MLGSPICPVGSSAADSFMKGSASDRPEDKNMDGDSTQQLDVAHSEALQQSKPVDAYIDGGSAEITPARS